MGPNKSYIQLSVPSLKSEYTDLCQPFAATIVSVTTGYSRRFCPIKKNHDLHSMILELIGLRATFSNDDIALPRNPPKVPKNTIFNSLMDIYRGKAKKSPLVQEMVLAVARARPIDACLSLLDHFTGCYDGKTVLGSRIVVNVSKTCANTLFK
jgi:hypothetical protein